MAAAEGVNLDALRRLHLSTRDLEKLQSICMEKHIVKINNQTTYHQFDVWRFIDGDGRWPFSVIQLPDGRIELWKRW